MLSSDIGVCWDFYGRLEKEHRQVKWEDEVERKRMYCCILRYAQSCSDPQRISEGNLRWREPPLCSNRDMYGKY